MWGWISRAEFRASIQRLDDNVTLAHHAHQELHHAAEKVLDERLERLNNLQARMAEQEQEFLRESTYAASHQALIDRISALENWRSTWAGKTTVIIAVVGFLLAIIGAFVGHLIAS